MAELSGLSSHTLKNRLFSICFTVVFGAFGQIKTARAINITPHCCYKIGTNTSAVSSTVSGSKPVVVSLQTQKKKGEGAKPGIFIFIVFLLIIRINYSIQ